MEVDTKSITPLTKLKDTTPSICEKCSDKCVCVETSTNRCSGCISEIGYLFNSTSHTCIACAANCTRCVETFTKCTECATGYKLIDNKCEECPSNCNSDKCKVSTVEGVSKTVCDPSGCENGWLYNDALKNCSE